MDLGLRDKVILVSGGSKGIGFAIAHAFAVEGAKVAITGRNAEMLETAYKLLKQTANGNRIVTIQADMTDESVIGGILDEVNARLGPIDAAVSNVGTGTAKPGIELDRSAWKDPIESNLMGGVLLASQLLPHMVERRSGCITFISSIAGVEAIKAPIPYSAAKAGLMMAMKSYAHQVGPKGVRVNAVAPGNVFVPGGTWAKKFEDTEKKIAFKEYIRNEVPLRRFASPREIADVAVFLSSNRASFITGSVVVVDGGQTRSYV